jgi:hypothetical protein
MSAESDVYQPPPANNPSEISDSNERNEGRKNQFRLSEGVLLALAPAYAYLLTFQYEKGFTSYFGIPDSFIDITLGNVLTLAGVVLGFVWVYLMMLNGIVMFIPSSVGNHPLIKRHVITLSIYSLFVYIPAYIYDTRSMWVFAISTTLLGIFTYFILPLILFRDKRGYLDKLEIAAARMDRDDTTNLIGWYKARINPWFTILTLIFAYFVFIAYEAGRMKAANQQEFLTTSINDREVVCLRAYADKLILTPFDRNTRRAEKRFIIVSLNDLKNPLYVDAVGPLSTKP